MRDKTELKRGDHVLYDGEPARVVRTANDGDMALLRFNLWSNLRRRWVGTRSCLLTKLKIDA